MKRYIISFKKLIIILGVGLFISSCESYTNGVSEFDPTQPVDASLGQVVNSAEVAFIGHFEGELARLAGMWSGQFTGVDRQYVALNNYTSTAPDYDNAWGNVYAGVLKPLRTAQEKAAKVNNLRVLGMAKILEAQTMATTTALFGDIPYSQANDLQKFPNPTFDSQVDIYNALLVLLDDAIDNINNGLPGTGFDGDFLGGDDAAWIAVANTVKAKIHLHLGQYQKAVDAAALGISDPSLDILAPHGGVYLQTFNIYYSFTSYDRPGYMSANGAFAPTLLDPDNASYRGNAKTDETARFNWYYYPGGLNVGADYDLNVLWSDDWGNDPTEDGFFGAISSFPIITFAENQLILAEASLRLGDPTGAVDALNSWRDVLATGYRISSAYQDLGFDYQQYDYSDFAPGGGIANPNDIAQDDALYQEIIEEKYLSLLGQLEVFNDMRRKGFGTFSSKQNWEVLGVPANTGSQIPQRFLIAQSEINSNTSTPKPSPGLFDKTEVNQ